MKANMMQLDKAFETIMHSAFMTGSEEIPFADSLNRILAEDVYSDMDLPPFNKSMVDGFACRKEDINHELELIETIPAGTFPSKNISVDKCSKIMTGAPVPRGADYVFMVEDSKVLESGRIKCNVAASGDNISKKGEDVREGTVVLRAGKQLRPQDIAVMASVGKTSIAVIINRV